MRKEVGASSQKQLTDANVTAFVTVNNYSGIVGIKAFRDQGESGKASASARPERSMYTTLIDKVSTPIKVSKHRFLTARSRRLYSRIIAGMKKKGRYYFVTFSLKKECKPIEWYWVRLRWWLKRYRPDSAWCYCLTNEHCGVIHMVVRLGRQEKRWEAKEVRDYWIKLTGFNHVTIRKVQTGSNVTLARYIQDQKKKYGLGKEMSYQDLMIRWRFCTKWLPVGYTRKNKREYGKMKRQNIPDEIIKEQLDGLLYKMFQDQEVKK